MRDFDQIWQASLDGLDAVHRRRTLRDVTRLPGGRIQIGDGPVLLDFSSNDYLGLSFRPELIDRACAYAAQFGAGAGASRLVAGNLAAFSGIEAKLAAGKGSEAALVFVSGVQANVTLLPALLDAKVLGGEPLVYADRLKTEFADVPEEMVRTQGPVSEPVARAMAEGIRRRTGASVGVGITGIAGPGAGAPGPDAEKPIGLVYVAISYTGERETKVTELHLTGDRERIRLWASQHGLELLRRSLLERM